MKRTITRLASKFAAIGLIAAAGITVASAAPAFASTKTLSDISCSVGTLVNGSHFQIGVTYDCTQTGSSTSGQPITISAVSNSGSVAAATWTANLLNAGMTYAFVNNATTAPQIHWTGTPVVSVTSGSTYNQNFQLSDGQAPTGSVEQGFRTDFQNITGQIAGTSGSTSVGTGSGAVASGSSITLTPTIGTLPTGYSLAYIWKKNGATISGATSSTYTDSSVTAATSYDLYAIPTWTDGVHTATSAAEMWIGSFSVSIRSAGSVITNPTTSTTTTPPASGTSSPSSFDESNTSATTLSDSKSLSGLSGTATFSDGSQIVIGKTGAVLPKLFTAFKGLASGSLKATYVSNKKTLTFTCAYAKFGSIVASPKATRSVNSWFPKSFVPAKKACVLPKAALTTAGTSTVKLVVKLTFGRLWPTTAKAINPDTKGTIKAVTRTMTLTFGKNA
jgi:hypothetical protein